MQELKYSSIYFKLRHWTKVNVQLHALGA